MSTATATPKAASSTKVVQNLTRNAEAIGKVKARLEALHAERDALVATARNSGVKYNDIADATGMSISWINSSLVRSDGFRPRAGRPRRKEE